MNIDFGRWVEAGYHCFPTQGKHPHIPALPRDENKKATWLPFKERFPTEEEITRWQKENNYTGVAVLLGKASGIIALDYDCFNNYPKILKYVVDSPIIRVGKSPKWMRIYKYNENLPSEKLLLKKVNSVQDGIELLTEGRYFVADGIHPGTGKPYFYTGEHLLDINKETLPEFPLENWLAIRREASKYDAGSTSAGSSEAEGGRHNALVSLAGKLILMGGPETDMVRQLEEKDKTFSESYFKTHKDTPEKMLKSLLKTDERNKKRMDGYTDISFLPKKIEEESLPTKAEQNLKVEEELPAFYTLSKSGIKPDFLTMSKYLKNKFNFVVTESGNFFYEKTHYVYKTSLELEKIIYGLTDKIAVPSHVDGFKKLARAHCYNNKFFEDMPRGFLNLANGLVNVRTREILSHSPEHKQKSVLPIIFHKDAVCPQWHYFLKQIFLDDEELIKLTREMFGYVLLGGDPFLQRAFCLYGTGRNGKSTLLHILKKLIGPENYSAVPMKLLEKPFSAVMLDRKIANICEETPADVINAEIFKTVVGGGAIVAAQKGQPEYMLNVQARFIFACNELPVFKDRTKGLEDRLVLIPFDLYLSDEARDYHINSKLESELPGILNWALQGANDLMDWGRLGVPQRIIDLKDEYKRESDSVYDYFKEKLEVISDDGGAIGTEMLYAKYADWCRAEGRYSVSRKTFTKTLRHHAKDEFLKLFPEFSDVSYKFLANTTKTTQSGGTIRAMKNLREKP